MQNLLETLWQDLTFVAFDTETTGRFPITAEFCEIAAVKWRGNQIVDQYVTLIRPSTPMGSEVIAIHGITNEMVAEAPRINEKIGEFAKFLEGAIGIAHHAPFDLGFLSIEFEKVGLPLPELPVLCSSLLSRKIWPESRNHKLQTLIEFFHFPKGAAHRALDDTMGCLNVALKCFERMGSPNLQAIGEAQGGLLDWTRFSLKDLVAKNPVTSTLIQASKEKRGVEIVYNSGSQPGKPREIRPEGIVRSLDGDFVPAFCEIDRKSKRFFVEKITQARLLLA